MRKANTSSVTVAVRVRPLNEKEKSLSDQAFALEYGDTYISTPTDSTYIFDSVFGPEHSTLDLYTAIAEPIVSSSLAGINGTIFAYGQTASGKTFSMQGSEAEPGILRLAAKQLFEVAKNAEWDYSFVVSYIEIYNERVKDLMNTAVAKYAQDAANDLKIRENRQNGFYVDGVVETAVDSYEAMMELFAEGEKRRHVAGTDMNLKSSRSHTIFTINVTAKQKPNETGDFAFGTLKSRLSLVDLAGSESARLTNAEGERLKEGAQINKSLLTLSLVISSLAKNNGKDVHVKFRDSKLTQILQPSLAGNCQTAVVCCVTPAASYISETCSTLKFASSAKHIQTQFVVNQIVDASRSVRSYQDQIDALAKSLRESEQARVDAEQIAAVVNGAEFEALVQKIKVLEVEKETIQLELNTIRASLDQQTSENTELSRKLITLTKQQEEALITFQEEKREEIRTVVASLKEECETKLLELHEKSQEQLDEKEKVFLEEMRQKELNFDQHVTQLQTQNQEKMSEMKLNLICEWETKVTQTLDEHHKNMKVYEESIENYKEQVNNLKENLIKEKRSRVEAETTLKVNADERLSAKEEICVSLQRKNEDLENDLEMQRSIIKEMKTEFKSLLAQHDENHLKELMKLKQEHEAKLTQERQILEEKLFDLTSQHKKEGQVLRHELERQVKISQENIQQERNEFENRLQKLNEEKMILMNEKENVKLQYSKRMESSKADFERVENQMKLDLTNSERELGKARESNQILSSTYKRLEGINEQLRTKLQEKDLELEEWQTKEAELRQMIETKDSDLCKVQDILSERITAERLNCLNTFEDQNRHLRNENNKLSEERKRLEKDSKGKQDEIDQLETRVLELKTDLDRVRKQLTEEKRVIAPLKDIFEEEMSKKDSKIQKLEKEIKVLKKSQESIVEMAEVGSQLSEMQGKYSSLEIQLKELQNENIELKTTQLNFKQTEKNYRDQIEKYSSKIKLLEDSLESYKKENINLKFEKKKLDEDIKTLQNNSMEQQKHLKRELSFAIKKETMTPTTTTSSSRSNTKPSAKKLASRTDTADSFNNMTQTNVITTPFTKGNNLKSIHYSKENIE